MVYVEELAQELLTLGKSLPAFKSSGFYVFDEEDLQAKTSMKEPPCLGVTYDGARPGGGNNVSPADAKAHGSMLVTLQFSFIIVVKYGFSGQSDTKKQATNLMDELRVTVAGYRGKNTRPWVFAGERPEPDPSEDGLVFYSQLWHTTIVNSGKFPKQ